MNLRPARVAVAVTFGLALSLLFPNYAPGAPIDDLKAKAAALEGQIESNGVKVAALGEQLNAAQIKVDQSEAKIADAQARIHVAEAETVRLKGLISERAAAIYKDAGNTGWLDMINTKDANDLTTSSKYTDVAASHDDQLISELVQAKQDLSREKSGAEKVREEAKTQRDELVKTKQEAGAAQAQEEQLLGRVKGEIGDFVQQEAARRQQAAVATSVRQTTPSGNSNWAGPGASGGAGAAVAFAQSQVGKPYCYAGTGPGCYDCSGLTMRAWQAGGLSLPHYSGAQYSMFPKVPLSQLQAGDLVFPSDPGQHVGIYVGGGMMVHATHTGDFIKQAPISSVGVTQAVRPG